MGRILACVVTAALMSASPVLAKNVRYKGTVASDLGGALRLTLQLRPFAGNLFTGKLKCKAPRGFRCVGKRGEATVQFTSDGGFLVALRFDTGVQCNASGAGSPGSVQLFGRYACGSAGRVVDVGTFSVQRK